MRVNLREEVLDRSSLDYDLLQRQDGEMLVVGIRNAWATDQAESPRLRGPSNPKDAERTIFTVELNAG